MRHTLYRSSRSGKYTNAASLKMQTVSERKKNCHWGGGYMMAVDIVSALNYRADFSGRPAHIHKAHTALLYNMYCMPPTPVVVMQKRQKE